MAEFDLEVGAAMRLFNGDDGLMPTLQIADLRALQSKDGNSTDESNKRFRVMLSDGQHYVTAMLSSQLNPLVLDGKLEKFTVVKLTEYLCQTINNRKIIIALQLELVGKPSAMDIIGQPVSCEQAASSGAAAPPMGGNQPSAPPTAGAYGQPQGAYGQPQGNYGQPQGNYGQPQGNYGQPQGNYGNNTGNYGAPPGGGHPPAGQPGEPAYGGYGNNNQQNIPPQYSNRGATQRNDAPHRVTPISSLNPYMNRWMIRVRVTNQPNIRSYHNARGDGKVLNVDLLDAEGGEIKAVCFNDTAERFSQVFQAGRVYDIQKGQISNVKNKKFNNADFEIRLDNGSVVEECTDTQATASIKKIHYKFQKIASIEDAFVGGMADVIGVVHTVGDLATIMKRDGGETNKRSVHLRDDSGASIELTM